MRDADDVTTIELKVADATVGQLRMRARDARARRLAAAAGDHADRLRGRARARARARLRGGGDRVPARGAARRDRRPRRPASPAARSSGPISRSAGACSSSRARTAHARPRTTGAGGCSRSPAAGRAVDRARRDRRARASATPARSSCSCPDADGETGRRVSAAILRELESGLAGFAFAIGRSRRAEDPLDLQRAGNEALLAVNVVEGDAERLRAGVRGHRHLPAAAART